MFSMLVVLLLKFEPGRGLELREGLLLGGLLFDPLPFNRVGKLESLLGSEGLGMVLNRAVTSCFKRSQYL
jgi:hypothetical protein